MKKLNSVILLIAIIFITTPLYSQVIYSGSIREQIERWEGKKSKNIIDYVLKLQLQSFKEETQVIGGKGRSLSNNYYLVIRTEINGWDPVEYQITLREDHYILRDSPSRREDKLMLIFEHPVDKSIRKQYEELKKTNQIFL
jgi:hypothetical protein